jgi:hypothetical protein
MPGRAQRSRKWCFTLNNYTDVELEHLQGLDLEARQMRYLVVGKEVSTTGTPHLQGFCYFVNKKSMGQVKKIIGTLRVHLEIAKGSPAQNREYCSKDQDFFEKGECPMDREAVCKKARRAKKSKMLLDTSMKTLVDEGEISLLSLPLVEKARTIYRRLGSPVTTDGPRGIWIVGPPGTGKTHYVVTKEPVLYWKPQNKWWDGYEGEEAILLDDLDSNCLGHYLKRWMDKYACTGEVKGGKVALQHKRFYVTSNYTPGQLWQDDLMMREAIERRCEMIVMDQVYEPPREEQ